MIEQSVQPVYAINLPNDKAQILDDFVSKGSLFVRVAGLSGVTAVAMGAYGAHSKYYVSYISSKKQWYFVSILNQFIMHITLDISFCSI